MKPEQGATAAAVSVVVPTHNRPELVRRCVEAVLAQTYTGEIEVLVVFDQCEMHEIDLVLPAARSVTRLPNDSRQPGLAGARNTGILAATGEYLAFCDDDDVWLPGKLEAQFRRLREVNGQAACATGILVETAGRRIRRAAPERALRHVDFVRDRIMEVNPCTLVVRRDVVLREVGLVDEDIPHGYGEDYDFLLRLTRTMPVVCVPEPMVVVSYHGGSYYAASWQKIIDGLEYLTAKHPELRQDREGSARILGQLALAHGGLGERRRAAQLVGSALRANPLEKRALAAAGVVAGVPANRVVQLARRMGRGV
jgi:glycosyltransferase involved in cell wall biosynthesis